MLTFSILIFLLCGIVNDLLSGPLIKTPFVDSSNADDRVRINLNLTLFKIPCSVLSLDY